MDMRSVAVAPLLTEPADGWDSNVQGKFFNLLAWWSVYVLGCTDTYFVGTYMQRSHLSACAVTMLPTDASQIDGQRLHTAAVRSQRWTSAAGWACTLMHTYTQYLCICNLHYIPGALTCILQPRAQDRTAACIALHCDHQHAGHSCVA
jgi:hypothetical protein